MERPVRRRNDRKGHYITMRCALEKKESPAVDEAYQRIAALKQRPVSIPKTAMLFHYDPNEPLHLPEKPAAKKTGEQSRI